MNAQTSDGTSTEGLRSSLEIERFELENKKLGAELEQMRRSPWDHVQRLSPLLGGLLALAGFLFGVWQYVNQQRTDRLQDQKRSEKEIAVRTQELQKLTEARDQEFMKPLWERELATYFRASEAVATIASTKDPAKRRAAEEDFWTLYRGPLVILETKDLSGAMVSFGNCLNGKDHCSDIDMNSRALAVSSAIQVAIQEHSSRRLSEFSKDKFQYHRIANERPGA